MTDEGTKVKRDAKADAILADEMVATFQRWIEMKDGDNALGAMTLSILSPDGSSYISAGTDAALTAEGAVAVELPATSVKAVVSGGSPSALYATLERIGL